VPDSFFVELLVRKRLGAQEFWMNPHDQYLFIVGTIENPDPPAFRQRARRASEKIMIQLLKARMFKSKN
jgi:hypothetical protein